MRPRILFVSLVVLFALWCSTATSAQSIPQWQPNTYYAVGALVMYNGVEYQCIQAHTSEVGWEPPNTPALWQPVSGGGGGTCSSVPSAPTGLAASSTSSSGTSLSWSAVSPPANCTITNYTLYENGSSIGTTTSTSFAVTGLSPSTTYTFTVAASDAAGMSGQSSSVRVTTSSGSGGGGGGSGCAPAWSSSQVYTGGMTASENGVNYLANYWTQGQDPATNNGPAGSGQPWTSQGSCASCSAIPSVPTSLNASGTNSTSTTLKWTASSASGCTITGYTIFENGNAIGSSTGTTFVVTGLSPQTTYTFTVEAVDSAGASSQSAAIQVTTSAGSGGGGGGNMFAPYMDISLGEGETVANMASQAGLKAITLAFLVDGGCVATWGGLGGNVNNATFPNGTTVASAINALEAEGVSVIISWGGANGSIQSSCTIASQVQAMYQSVFNAYPGIVGQDFDIEGNINNSVVAQALAGLKAANPGKLISLTLPVLPTGLVSAGINILDACASAGFNPDVVNVMAMDYGSANDNGGQMGLDATDAASATETQIHQAGLSSSVGVTPMIGVNDTNTEIFQPSDANTLLNFAKSNSYITRLAMWSLARDNGGCAGQGYASPTCSGISQSNYQFSSIFETF